MVKSSGGYSNFFRFYSHGMGLPVSRVATGRYFACNQDLGILLDQFITSSNRRIQIVIIMYNKMGAPRCTNVQTSGAVQNETEPAPAIRFMFSSSTAPHPEPWVRCGFSAGSGCSGTRPRPV